MELSLITEAEMLLSAMDVCAPYNTYAIGYSALNNFSRIFSFFEGLFKGVSNLFLSCLVPKSLILVGKLE